MARLAALVMIGTVLGTAGLGRAQSLGGAEGLVIGSVRYDPPERDRRADEDAGLPVGSVLTGAATRRAIRAIWSLHRYSDVRILVDRTPDGRVDVIVRTSLIARVAEISVRGNLALSRDQVVRGAAVRLDQEITTEEVPVVEAAVERTYAERGFGAARATASIRRGEEPGRVRLVLRVEEGPPILVHRVIWEGDPRMDVDRITTELGVRAGLPFDQVRLRRGVERVRDLYRSLGHYDVAIGDPRPEVRADGRGIDLHVPIRPGPRFTIVFEGSLRARSTDLRAALELDSERGLSDAVLATLEGRLVDWYRRRGFPRARVAARRDVERDGRTATLRIRIAEGRQVKVTRLAIVGNHHFDDTFLREQVYSFLEEEVPASLFFQPVDIDALDTLGISGHPRGPNDRPPPIRVAAREVFDAEVYRHAVEHLIELYRADGYLSVAVDPPRVFERDGRARVRLQIHEGPRTMLQSVRWIGNEAVTSAELALASTLEPGMPLSMRAVGLALEAVEKEYARRGFLFARVDREIETSQDGRRARLTFRIEERVRVRISSIVVRGNEITSDTLIRERIGFVAGEIYSPDEADRARERLMALGIFRAVTIEPLDPEVVAAEKAVLVTVRERPTQYVDVHGGGSTGEGIRVGLEYGYRNLFGWALALTLRTDFSYQVFFPDSGFEQNFRDLSLQDQLERRLIVGLALPSTPAVGFLSTGLQFSHQRQNEISFGYTTLGALFSVTTAVLRPFTPRLDFGGESTDLKAYEPELIEKYLADHEGDQRVRRLLRVPQGQSSIGLIGSSLALDLRDNPFTPTQGFFGSVSGELVHAFETGEATGDPPVETPSDFLKVSTLVSGYVPLGASSFVLALSGRLGWIFHLLPDSQAFQNRRFFLGGTDTIRGFPEESMIPQDLADEAKRQQREDPSADPLPVTPGGDAFVTMRGELRFPLLGPLAGALFVDTGNLWSQTENAFSPFDLRTAVGAGVRVVSPVGALAFDYGLNLAPRRYGALHEPAGALHFSVGLF